MAGFIDLRRNIRDDMAIAQQIGGNIGEAIGKHFKQKKEQMLIQELNDPNLTPGEVAKRIKENASSYDEAAKAAMVEAQYNQQYGGLSPEEIQKSKRRNLGLEPKTETEGQLVNDIVRLTNAADKTYDPAQLQFFTDMIYQKQQKVQALRGPGYKPHISDEQLKSDIDTAVLSAKDAKWGKHDYSKKNLLNAWNGIVEKYDLNNDPELYKRVKDKWNETIGTKKDPGEYDWDPNEIGAMPTIPAAGQQPQQNIQPPVTPLASQTQTPLGTQQGQKPAGNKADREIENLLPESDHDKTMRNWTSQMGLDMFTPGEKVTTPNGTEIGNYDQAGKIILNDTGLQWLVSYGKANNLTREQTLQFAKENNWIVK